MKQMVIRLMDKHLSRPSISWQQSFAIVLPLVAEHLFTIIFGLLNTGMISSSGVTSLSAVSLVDSLNQFLFVFYTGIATGASVVVANYRGRSDQQKLHEASIQAVSSVTLFTIVTALFIIVFHRALLTLLFDSVEEEIMQKARLYLLGGAITLPLVGVTHSVCAVLRGIGEGRTSLGYTIWATVIYAGLNVLFLTVLNWGVPGLVLSVTLSRILNVTILLALVKRSHSQFTFRFREFFRIDFSMLRSIMKVGFPCAAEQLFFTGGRLVTQTIIAPMGTNAIVTYNIAYSIMLLNQALASPITTSMFTITGICMGHNRPQDARDLGKSFIGFNSILYVFMSMLTMLLFPYLVRFYNAPQETVDIIRACVLITAVVHPFLHSIGFTLPAVFRAAGDGLYCTVSVLTIMWVVRVFGGLVLGTWLGMGVMGVWLAMVLDWVVRVILFPIRFKGDRWLRHKVLPD